MSNTKAPADRCDRTGISMPKRVWTALDQMRGMVPTSPYLAELVKQKWHLYLDEHPDLVKKLRAEDPAMLLDYDLHRSAATDHPTSGRGSFPHAFAAETRAVYSVRKKGAA